MKDPLRDRFAPVEPGGWEVLATRCVVDHPFMPLHAETVRTPAGAVFDSWWVLRFPDWVMVVPFTDDGRVVLIRQWRQGARHFGLEIPAGVMDAQDADPVLTAARELEEETGFRAARLDYAGWQWPDASRNANRMHVVVAHGCVPDGLRALEPGETIEPVLVTVAECRALLLRGEMRSALHASSLLRGLVAAGVMEV